MAAMVIETSGQVATSLLTDGMIVRLCGDVTTEHVSALREALLTVLPAGCRDVLVDAGDVASIDSTALAVVFAGWAWVEEHDGRFMLSRTSPAFEEALEHHGVDDDLPRLPSLPSAPAPQPQQRRLESVPRPRSATV